MFEKTGSHLEGAEVPLLEKTSEHGQIDYAKYPSLDNLRDMLKEMFPFEPEANPESLSSQLRDSSEPFRGRPTTVEKATSSSPTELIDSDCHRDDKSKEVHNKAAENECGNKEDDNPDKSIENTLDEYFKDLKEKSECPDTIPDKPFEASDLKKLSPEENSEMREEFDDKKAQLKKEWEAANGRPWPKYDHDVYSSNGKLIRKAGSDYDAHHIQPLGMGGKNEASNITPLNAEVHYDKQGIHSPDSPYSKLDQMLGGSE